MEPEATPPEGAPPAEDGAGQAVAAVGQALEKLASQLPEFAEVLDLYKSIAEGGGAQPAPNGPVPMEAGASGAQPMTMGRPG